MMKKIFTGLLLTAIGYSLGGAAPADIYINNSPLFVPPQVDATIFLNRSTFDIITTLPYQAQNVQFWTNTGIMSGSPGYRFEYNRDGKLTSGKRGKKGGANSKELQLPSQSFHNDGGVFGSGVISITANSIVNPGRLDSSEIGRILVQATNGTADLSRSGIRAGPATGINVPCDFESFGTNFFPDANIRELYWGAGRNNDLGTNGAPLNLPSLPFANGGNLSLPFPSSPTHQVIQLSANRPFTNFARLPQGSFFGGALCGTNYEAFVHTSLDFSATPPQTVVSIVFAPVKSLLSPDNLDVDVRFTPDFGPAGITFAPVVEFRNIDFDIVNQALVTNYVTFIDTTVSRTNVTLSRAQTTITPAGTIIRPGNTRRPSTHTYIRGRYCSFDFAQPANTIFSPTIFYGPNFLTNTANTIYAASSVYIGVTNTQTFIPTIIGGNLLALGVNTAASDPTNFTGKVEINANDLNLNLTRIKAENFISIKANNLTSNLVAQLDAPFIDLNLQSTNSTLVISNLAPPFVNRLAGQIAAWSSAWNVNVTNDFGQTNNMRFHVLIVDNCLRSEQPVTLNRFSARTPQLVIQDNLLVNAGLSLNAPTICVETNATLALPLGSDWAFTNVQNLLNFTNYGTVNIQGGGYFGAFDVGHLTAPKKVKKKKKKQVPVPPSPLDTFVNHGSLSASALFVRATNAEVTGSPFVPALFNANNGVISVTASRLVLSNATILAGSDAEFRANDLHVSRSFISAGTANNALGQAVRGALVFDATNSFGDGGLLASNLWVVNSGVRVPTYPVVAGDLMGTQIYSTASPFLETPIVWSAEDRGVSPDGFTNNLAVGQLTLDGSLGNLFRFRGSDTNTALYIDYLELLNTATNYNFALGVSPGFTVYIADSNVSPEKLNDQNAGRIRWVSDFAGPRSSTNLLYPNGITYAFNAGLVRSFNRDDDNDGFPNDVDCTPVIPPGEEGNPNLWSGQNCPAVPLTTSVAKSIRMAAPVITISLAPEGREVILTWDAPANSANSVEFTETLDGVWQPLTNFVNGPVDARVTLRDAATASLRVYRVHVDAGKP
jgi:hypothetical protein